jgi:chemotaxis methyl-accepting protein methylase
MRNRAEMELMRSLISEKPEGAKLAIAVLACSKGAEVYSITSTIRSARPDLRLCLTAVDISQEITAFAQNGIYSLQNAPDGLQGPSTRRTKNHTIWNTYRDQGPLHNISIFERLGSQEIEAMFDIKRDMATIKPWLKKGIRWETGDASEPSLVSKLGPQDIVVANRFLCHMEPQVAERCLRNIARLVRPGGYLFVSGVDLDIRAKVAQELGWIPVDNLMQEVYEGDPSLTNGWPLGWWGIEPFSKKRTDWQYRYCCVYQLGAHPVRGYETLVRERRNEYVAY